MSRLAGLIDLVLEINTEYTSWLCSVVESAARELNPRALTLKIPDFW